VIFLLLILSGSLYLLILSGLVFAWCRVSYRSKRPEKHPSFSVIIPTHNEAENLRLHLSSWLEQTYQDYELIIVLDRCEDGSEAILQEASLAHSRLRYLLIRETPKAWAAKKWAVQQGIEAATYEHLVFTDADCEATPDWLKSIAEKWGQEDELVLGTSPYRSYPGLLNALIQFETSYTALQYIGFAWWGLPYMGVGRNMAYTKDFFQKAGGFTKISHRMSGDDDLLVNRHAKASRTALLIGGGSHTLSEPKHRWGDWLRQKFRHVSASPAYTLRSKMLLGSLHFSHLGFFLLVFWIFFSGTANHWVLGVIFMRIIGGWLLWGIISTSLVNQAWLLLYPLLDFLFFLYNLIAVPIGLLKQPKWIPNTKSPKTQKKTGS
jgi:biofilm PGA synthesis N-glycosyltransferase PgaC